MGRGKNYLSAVATVSRGRLSAVATVSRGRFVEAMPTFATSKAATISTLLQTSEQFWQEAVNKPWFTPMAKAIRGKKEAGASISSEVDTRTLNVLKRALPKNFITEEADKSGRKVKRSIGDFWIKEGDHYAPVNVKTGVTIKGRPNLVALNKLRAAIKENKIDNYYLLIVKFSQEKGQTRSNVAVVDLFDCLDHVGYDNGTGQLMLKENAFHQAYQAGEITAHTLSRHEKLVKLAEIYEEGYQRMLAARAATRERLMRSLANTNNDERLNQTGLNFS